MTSLLASLLYTISQTLSYSLVQNSNEYHSHGGSNNWQL